MPVLSLTPKQRAKIFRAHFESEENGGGPIYDEDEIAIRGDADALLGLAGVLEVLAIATGADLALPHSVAEKFDAFLSSPEVRVYYEKHYPVALPTLLRLRLLGQLPDKYRTQASAKAAGRTMSWLISFFELDSRIRSSVALEMFLDMLDDYSFYGVGLDEVITLLDDRKIFENAFMRRAKRISSKESAETLGLRGLDEFLRFASDYNRLLQNVEERPLLQSAFWIHQCYWFGAGGGSIRETARRLQRRLRALSRIYVEVDEEPGLELRIIDACAALEALTNIDAHSQPIVSAAAPALARWRRNITHKNS